MKAITYNEFKIVPISAIMFDLERTIQVTNKQTGEKTDKQNVIAYGVSLEGAIKRIAGIIVQESNEGDIVLKEYINQLNNQVQTIKNLFK